MVSVARGKLVITVDVQKVVNRRLVHKKDCSGQNGKDMEAALRPGSSKRKKKGTSPVERRRVKEREVVVGRDKGKIPRHDTNQSSVDFRPS